MRARRPDRSVELGPGSLHDLGPAPDLARDEVAELRTGEVGEFLGTRGHEFGTNTGRQRRCGWFDAVLVRQAVKVGGVQGLVLTKLDVLDGLKELKVCVG